MRDDERTKRALVFGEVAELYDRARPSYPGEVIDEVIATVPRASAARVLEDWVTAGPPFAAIVAAHCWHWVDPRVGYTKARALLGDDGVLAAFWNVPVLAHSPLAPAIDEAYRAHAPDLEDKTSTTRASYDESFAHHPGFRVRHTRDYSWDQEYTAREYTDMLRTHSDHHLLAEDARTALLGAVTRVIDDAGGTITLRYDTLLVVLEPE